MTRVMIGGSRRISRLNEDVRQRLDRIVEKRLPVLIGDANGVDRAVQDYLHSHHYDRVEVFCVNGICRNNVGGWTKRAIPAPRDRKDFRYYATKDQAMADEASIGLMIWDGKSAGTLANVFRLIAQHKIAVIYIAPEKRFLNLRDQAEWEELVSHCPSDLRDRIEQEARDPVPKTPGSEQAILFQ